MHDIKLRTSDALLTGFVVGLT